jgi:hypothetical protein
VSLGAFLGARLGLFLAGVEGGRRAVEVGLGVLWWFLSCWVGGRSGLSGVSTGSPSGLGLWGWESLVRCGVGRTAWGLAAVFVVGPVGGVFGVGGRWFPW